MTRVVLVGAGKVGLKESQALRRHPDYELLAVCDSGRERRSAVAEVTGVPTYDSLSACLSAGVSPDLVQIATPPESHHSIAMQALAAGADVYIEKVMTLRESEAAEIVDTAAKSRLNVYVRRNSLYTPVFRRLLRATGEVGRVKRVTFTNAVSGYDEYEPEKAEWLRTLPGGVISEHLPHALYVVRHLMGTEPDELSVEYDEETLMVDLYADGVRGAVTYLPPGDVAKTVSVVGTEGSFLLNEDTRQLRDLRTSSVRNPKARIAADNGREILSTTVQAAKLAGSHARKHVLNTVGSERGRLERNTHYRQLTDIAGIPAHDISGQEGLKNVSLFEEIWRQAGEPLE